jgi:hypothetical protein
MRARTGEQGEITIPIRTACAVVFSVPIAGTPLLDAVACRRRFIEPAGARGLDAGELASHGGRERLMAGGTRCTLRDPRSRAMIRLAWFSARVLPSLVTAAGIATGQAALAQERSNFFGDRSSPSRRRCRDAQSRKVRC